MHVAVFFMSDKRIILTPSSLIVVISAGKEEDISSL
jgi:hypothetical protein